MEGNGREKRKEETPPEKTSAKGTRTGGRKQKDSKKVQKKKGRGKGKGLKKKFSTKGDALVSRVQGFIQHLGEKKEKKRRLSGSKCQKKNFPKSKKTGKRASVRKPAIKDLAMEKKKKAR